MADNIETKVRGLSRLELEKASSQTLARLIIKSSTLIMVVTLIQKLLGLLLFRTLALHFGPSTFGDWNTAIAFLSFFSIITDAGIDTVVVREASRNQLDLARLIGTAILAKLVLAGLAFSLCVLIVFLMPYRLELKLLVMVAAVPLFSSFNTIYGDVLQAEMKIGYVKVVGLTASLLLTIGGFTVVWLNGNLFTLALVNILVSIPVIFMYQRFADLITKVPFRFDFIVFKALFKEALPLAFSGIFVIIYFRIDTVLLSIFKNADSVGYYAATYKLTEVLNLIPGAVMIPVFPILSRYAQNPAFQKEMLRLYYNVLKYLGFIIFPVVLTIVVLAEQIILLIYSPTYLPAASGMRLIIWAEIPMFLNPVVYQLAVAHGRQGLLTQATGLMALFNLASNLVLIPLFDFNGAALATALTEFVGLFLGLWLIYKTFQIGLPGVFRAVFSGLIPFSLCLLLVVITGNLLFIVPGTVLYLGMFARMDKITLLEFKKVWSRFSPGGK